MRETETGFQERLKNQSEGAVQSLYDEYGPFIRSVLARHGVRAMDLTDVQQELVIRILRAVHGVPIRSFRAWLYVVCYRTAYRYKRRCDEAAGGTDSVEILRQIPSRESLPDAAFDKAKTDLLFQKLSAILSDREWAILEGMQDVDVSQSDMARRWGVSAVRIHQIIVNRIIPLVQKLANEL